MKPYPKYKDSGVEWLGDIPEHWEIKRLKYLASVTPSNIDKKSKEDERPILLCNYIDVHKNKFITNEIDFMAATASESQIAKFSLIENDVIVTKDSEDPSDIAVPALVKQNLKDVMCGYHLTLLRAGAKNLSGEFLFWFFNLKKVRNYFAAEAKGITRYGLGLYTVENIFIIVPSLSEQTTIANYLDRKTAEIDRLIANKERLVELYDEVKQAIINQAVTQGLDANVKLKPSGVEWIGDIPEHWEVRRLKTIADVVLGKMLKTSPSKNDQLKPYLRSANIQWFEPNTSDIASMWFSSAEMEQYRISKNDILVSEGGEVGRACIWQDELEECYIQNSVHKVTAGAEILPFFILYQFSVLGSKGVFKTIVNRVSIAHLTLEKLVAVSFCKPPLEEQQAIITHINKKCAKIGQAISCTERKIELIREYRMRLISEVVTGKIDVRDEADYAYSKYLNDLQEQGQAEE